MRQKRRTKEVKDDELRNVVEQRIVNKLGDGVVWLRGGMIGEGSFGSVYLATLKKHRTQHGIFPSLMAVKSAEISASCTIQKEREVFSNIKGSPYVIRCFGEETTRGVNGEMVYNLLLEFGSGGTLANLIRKSGGVGLPELNVRYYTRSVLRGLKHIHDCGYVHCDLKPDNILLIRNSSGSASDFKAKIGDFGLAKRPNFSKKRKLDPYPMGTPAYWSPETVNDGIQGPSSDVWALGLIVLEMLTGKPLSDGKEEHNSDYFINPRIPNEISKEGKGFLKACFVKKVMFRFTAEMLLLHPFVQGLIDDSDAGEADKVTVIDEMDTFLVLTDTSADDELTSSSSLSDEEEYFTYTSDEGADGFSDESLSLSSEVAQFQAPQED